jgi:hypothetical protein
MNRRFDFVFFSLLAVVVAALALLAFGPADAAGSSAAAPTDAHGLIAKMIARQPSLTSYQSRVHVDVRMLSFPYFAPKLDGTTYYRKDGSYEVVFDRVPAYAKGFSKLFDDVGDPAAWEKDNNVALDGQKTVDGHSLLVLRLTKKIHSTILDRALAYVDPTNYELTRMEWDYTSGGKIVMDQIYRTEGGFSVLSTQHATIDIPHVRAVADAKYGRYQTNVSML